MRIVGICGPISSGKSTFAEFLTSVDPQHSLHLETSSIVVELANTLNAALAEHSHELATESDLIGFFNGLLPVVLPQLRQMTGKELTEDAIAIDPNDVLQNPDWYEKLLLYLRQAQQMPSIVSQEITQHNKSNYRPLLQWIGGYFLYRLDRNLLWYEELLKRAALAPAGTELVALTAPRQPREAAFVKENGGTVVKIVRPGLISDTEDVTERLVAEIEPDSTVINDSDLDKLRLAAKKLHADLMAGTVKATYKASASKQP